MKFILTQLILRFRWILLLIFMSHLASCTTTGTGKMVLNMPMDTDLEKRVMMQTGLSGAIIGGLAAGALAVGLLALASAAGAQPNNGQIAAIGGAAVAAGVFAGWQQGKKQGKKIVATAKERDQLNQLVKGARDYNASTAQYIAVLRKQVADAKRTKDARKLATLRKEASAKVKRVDARVADRSKAVQGISPDHRSLYSKTLPELKREKSELENVVKSIISAEHAISL